MKNLYLIALASIFATSLMHTAAPAVPAVTPMPMPVIAPITPTPMPMPVATPITPAPKFATPITPAPMPMPVIAPIIAPTTTVTTAPGTTKLPVQINIKNTSNFAAKLTGFTIIHKDSVGNQHSLSQTISHQNFKILPASAKKPLLIEFNLKAVSGTFFVGTSAIFINGQSVPTLYKNEPWNRGMTDAIYVTSKDGTTWTLDTKAMDKAANPNNAAKKPTNAAKTSTAGKVTSITKDLTASLIHHKVHQPTAVPAQPLPKGSQAAQASAKAITKTTVNKPTIA